MRHRSQADRVLDHLATGRPLTPLAALKRFGTFRLGARIYDLRKQGHNITSRMVKRGEARVAEYRLVGHP